MAKGARFDNSFLFKQVEKRKDWKSRGVKAGHGGEFNIDSPMAEINRAVSGSLMPPAAMTTANSALLDCRNIPSWMIRAMERDNEVAYAATQKKVDKSQVPSPYKRRIGQGIKSEKERTNPQYKEHWVQVRLFYNLEVEYPVEFEVVYAVPNGGLRAGKTAAMMMYEGQKTGTPDIAIPIPKGKYHGMFLEVKTETGTVSKVQKDKLAMYSELGYYAVSAKGFKACWSELVRYFGLPAFDNLTTLTSNS